MHDLSEIGILVTEAQAESVTRLAAKREDGGTAIPIEEIRKAIESGDGDVERATNEVVALICNYGPTTEPPVGSVWNGVYFEGPNGTDTHIGRRDKAAV